MGIDVELAHHNNQYLVLLYKTTSESDFKATNIFDIYYEKCFEFNKSD